MFVANHTIVDWGPHGMWLSNCSDDINSTICDYTTKNNLDTILQNFVIDLFLFTILIVPIPL